jgi:hypothetical protein
MRYAHQYCSVEIHPRKRFVIAYAAGSFGSFPSCV